MRITLIFPGITIDGFTRNRTRPKTGWIHHGLCSISASLKQAGHEVSLIDLRGLFGWYELPHALRKLRPDVVGITMMSLDFNPALKSAEIVRKTLPHAKIIMGGAHPSLMSDELTDNSHVDYIFRGEAEETLPLVIEDLRSGKTDMRVLDGSHPDLDVIPFPDRSLFSVLEAPIVPFLKMPFITAIAGRGCAYNCSFCQPAEKKIFGRTVRRMSPARFVEELDRTRRDMGLNSLMIHDDCLLEDREWVHEFLRLYEEKKFRAPFVCQGRADIIAGHAGLIKDMRRSGLEMILIGFESGSQRVLNFLRKGTRVEDNFKAAAICRKLGIRVWANFMLGIPTETKGEVLDTVRMIKKIRPYVASPAFYTPHPGSDLFDYCRDNGLSLVTKHEDYRRNPEGAKIRGVDYDFLRGVLAETVRLPWSVRMKRKVDRLKLGHFNKDLIKSYEPR
ncbi:MAG: radical SAM protein [Candidatus Omnitrophota bacterium]